MRGRVLLSRWAELCLFATAQRPALQWPAQRKMSGAVHDLVAALARQNITWLEAQLFPPRGAPPLVEAEAGRPRLHW